MVLLSAGAYRSSPANETVIVALPFLILLILPFSTITISVLFEVYVKLPASSGVKVAPESTSSLAFKAMVGLAISISVCILTLFNSMVYEAVSYLPVIRAFPPCLAVYVIFSSIEAAVLSKSPNV